ncbi:glycoside hydrolase family 32 protein [Marinimicrobium alkaliphilum]|uniref:glycoside hydrolase family 32 protein n=1 Tax=Marinimicrobium alkaliphilum TaxID=2202654 RepID=UPI000DBA5818|nr:glycoside hydrolase family 32 protein [Marinimicrobium alkaliphilum]
MSRFLMLLTPIGCALTLMACGSTNTAVTSSDGPNDSADSGLYAEDYRLQQRFSPQENWLNDPNGLVYLDGTYHMFYQYNPNGDQWGYMSWAHATSTDLVHWEEQGVKLPYQTDGSGAVSEMIFSGTAIVDHDNAAGFGENAILAFYTSHYPQGSPDHPGNSVQAQSVAYSTDNGETWTFYEGNPVVDIGHPDFRDPKVFKYTDGEQDKWIMAVTLSIDRQVAFYESTNLVDWALASTFGPANSVSGIWEMPDLSRLPVDGDPNNQKWVMLLSVGDGGAPNGGSGVQYFIGDFDGTHFTADNVVDDPMTELDEGVLFEDFESGYGQWTATGDAFGDAPAQGALHGQQPVTGYLGDALVNSFLGGDETTGTLTSDEFEITHGYIHFLIGGGRHPADSPEGETTFNLYIDGERVRSATGRNAEHLEWESFHVEDYVGQTGQLRVIDANAGDWGHINVDHIWFSGEAFEPQTGELWMDHGADFYAPFTWENMPDDRRVTIGWASNWRYAGAIPTEGWRGSMSLAREMTLRTVGDQVQLFQEPVEEVKALRSRTAYHLSEPVALDGQELEITGGDFRANTAEVELEFELGDAEEVGLRLVTGPNHELVISYDVAAAELRVDRRRSGHTAFHQDFPALHRGPMTAPDGRIRLRVYFDTSMVEVFGNDGETVFANRYFPHTGHGRLFMYSEGGRASVNAAEAWELKSIWR